MSACPCCLEDLRPAVLGLGGRSVAGVCGVCADAVCGACLSPARPGRPRVCRSCVWDSLVARGETPHFAEPPGHRRRVAQAACAHARAVRWMGCCPDCGVVLAWPAEHDNPSCDACGAPSHLDFNCCWACGESFEEHNAPTPHPEGYALEYPCRSTQCRGRVAWLMPHCPWCAAEQRWVASREPGAAACTGCHTRLDPTWAFCATCGDEAPLPEACFTCATRLVRVRSAARCEHCRHIVCCDCFDTFLLPDDAEGREQLLCVPCADVLGAELVDAGAGDDAEADADDEGVDAAEEDAADADDVNHDEDADDGAHAGDLADADDDAEEDDDSDAVDDASDDGADDDAAEDDAGRHAPGAGTGTSRDAAADEDADDDLPDPWAVLGVRPGTPLPDVRRAYLTLVAQYHPDKVAQLGPKLQAVAQEETRRLNAAWSLLRARAG